MTMSTYHAFRNGDAHDVQTQQRTPPNRNILKSKSRRQFPTYISNFFNSNTKHCYYINSFHVIILEYLSQNPHPQCVENHVAFVGIPSKMKQKLWVFSKQLIVAYSALKLTRTHTALGHTRSPRNLRYSLLCRFIYFWPKIYLFFTKKNVILTLITRPH